MESLYFEVAWDGPPSWHDGLSAEFSEDGPVRRSDQRMDIRPAAGATSANLVHLGPIVLPCSTQILIPTNTTLAGKPLSAQRSDHHRPLSLVSSVGRRRIPPAAGPRAASAVSFAEEQAPRAATRSVSFNLHTPRFLTEWQTGWCFRRWLDRFYPEQYLLPSDSEYDIDAFMGVSFVLPI